MRRCSFSQRTARSMRCPARRPSPSLTTLAGSSAGEKERCTSWMTTASAWWPSMTRRLIQFKIHRQIENHVDRLAVQRARPELPLPHGLRGALAEAHRQAFDHLHLLDLAVLVDDGLDDDDAGDARLARHVGVDRIDALLDDRCLHVAADAQRALGFGWRRRLGR